MIVALDATPLALARGGLRRYTEELLRALVREFPQDQFIALAPQPGRWWSFGLPRELRRSGVQVFHGTNFEVPLTGATPAVVTIHDMVPWRGYPASRHVRQRGEWAAGLGLAAHVITVSEAVRREVMAEFRLSADRVTAIPLAASPIFYPDPPREMMPYLLYAGDLGERKNVPHAREVARLVGLPLVIAAETSPNDDELRRLYSGASAVLYPSFYEGFGLPVLEAMQCGAPVVISRDPALRETAGEAAPSVDVADMRGWLEAVRAVTGRRAEWAARSMVRAAQFSWRQTAHATCEIYRAALSGRLA